MNRLPCLTVHPPWASLIIGGIKTVENRTWRPPAHLIGKRIGIHASRKRDDDACMMDRVLKGLLDLRGRPEFKDRQTVMPKGMILGTVLLAGWVHENGDPVHIPTLKFSGRDWAWREVEVPYGWILRDPEVWAEPVPVRGHQGIWYWSFDSAQDNSGRDPSSKVGMT